ncbi:hypothetical protein HYV31_03545 [candidate division WWE3 bacterium]|nr:hypothetical protein [candidate division WWE3 bacterium]
MGINPRDILQAQHKKSPKFVLTVEFALRLAEFIKKMHNWESIKGLRDRSNLTFAEFFNKLSHREKTVLGRLFWQLPFFKAMPSMESVGNLRELTFEELRYEFSDTTAAFLAISFGCKKYKKK